MTRSLLPQDFIRRAADYTEDFETTGDWSVVSNAAISTDSENFLTGTQSVKLTCTTPGTAGKMEKTGLSWDIGGKTVEFWVYLHDPTKLSSITGYLSNSAWSKYWFFSAVPYVISRAGWYKVCVPFSTFTPAGTLQTTTINTIRIQITPVAGEVVSVSFDDMQIGIERYPTIVWGFDDGYRGLHDYGIDIFHDTVVHPTVYSMKNLIQTPGSEYMNLEETLECQSAGMSIGNHTIDHTNLSTVSTEVAVEKCVLNSQYLIANGMSRAANHLAYPVGGYTTDLFAPLASAGILSARGTISFGVGNTYCRYASWPGQGMYKLPVMISMDGTNLATWTTILDYCIRAGYSVHMFNHDIGRGHALSSSTEVVQQVIDVLTDRSHLIRSATIDEWYNGLTNPRYRSLPVTRATV